jgi:hypothetical protein
MPLIVIVSSEEYHVLISGVYAKVALRWSTDEPLDEPLEPLFIGTFVAAL